MSDFEHKLERRDGGQMTVSVKADALTFTIPPPVTPNEKEVMSGLQSLADALKRNVNGGDVQSRDGDVALTIATPNGRDNALAMVAITSLQSQDMLKPGESNKFATALKATEQAPVQQAPAVKELSDIKKAASAIGDALRDMVKADNMNAAPSSKVAHTVAPELPDVQTSRA